MHNVLLGASSIVTVFAVWPYIRDIVRGRSRPNIVSWITWALLTGIATIAEFSSHEYRTAFFTGAVTVEELTIIVLGLRYGYVKYTRFDWTCQIGALGGFLLWWLFNSPLMAVITSVAIDFVGALPTVRHSWMKPFEETWVTYFLSALGGALAVFALTEYNATSLAYPLWIVVLASTITGVILYRRHAAHPA